MAKLTTTAKVADVKAAVDEIGRQIREATTSMTSVPKPLKFLRPHYADIKAAHASVPAAAQAQLADVVSVLATVSAEEGSRDALQFCLKGTGEDPSRWGHEYIGHLAGEIATEHEARESAEPPESVDDLMRLVQVWALRILHGLGLSQMMQLMTLVVVCF